MVTAITRTLPEARALLTIPEVAAYLSLSRSGVYGLMYSGRLPHVKLGRSRRIKWADVLGLIDENTIGGDGGSV